MKITFQTTQAKKADAILVFAEDKPKQKSAALTDAAKSLDKKVKGALTKAMKASGFTGKKDTYVIIPGVSGVSANYVVIWGLGDSDKIEMDDFEKAGSALVPLMNKAKVSSVSVLFDMSCAEAATYFALGAYLNIYRFDKYLTKGEASKKPSFKSMTLTTALAVEARKLYATERKVADGVFLTRDLVSEVPNVLYPESFAEIIKKDLTPLGIEVKILTEKEMQKMGMGALLAVGQGSARPPRLVSMAWKGGKKGDAPVAFVGKGITFDTGGISLKPAPGMEEMKWDMGGAGVVTGLMKALAGRKAAVNAVGVVALAENMPSGTATRPGDIVTSMSGQTIEILNTDAEGRLVLSDALWYTQETFKPKNVIDLATLTGAVIIALGHEYAAVFSNNDDLPKDLMSAGKQVREELWHMPLCDAWDKDINSAAADMRNIGSGRAAGSAVAAHFLQRFIQKGVHWAHLDIAGMAWAYKDKPAMPKGASGFGVRLLDRYVRDRFEQDAV